MIFMINLQHFLSPILLASKGRYLYLIILEEDLCQLFFHSWYKSRNVLLSVNNANYILFFTFFYNFAQLLYHILLNKVISFFCL